MSIKKRIEKLETKNGPGSPYILFLEDGMTENEALAANLAETDRPPPNPQDLVIIVNKH